MRARISAVAIVALAMLTTACSNADPLAEGPEGDDSSIVVGSQQYYSNEIIAELYAQALEDTGVSVTRQFQIGQREVYMPEMESGNIDVMPEYGGNLLQYLDDSAQVTDRAEIDEALGAALPDNLRALDSAEATDQDSYVVTRGFAEEHKLQTIGDLAGAGPVKLAANSEFETRPYGPSGAREVYGVDVTVQPVEDSGGPLTVKALVDGDAQVADIYSADPAIEIHDLVVLEDPKGMILPQHVTPIVSDAVDDRAADVIDEVNARLTATELIALNRRSVEEQLGSGDIAGEWLRSQGLVD